MGIIQYSTAMLSVFGDNTYKESQNILGTLKTAIVNPELNKMDLPGIP